MPIYEYECPNCNMIFDQISKIGEDTAICINCNKPAKKIMSSSTFLLKGDGWAKDGYGPKVTKKEEVKG